MALRDGADDDRDPVDDLETIELRVHGVSGTTPEALLDRPLVEQVAGDVIAGFYRPRLVEERHDSAPNRHAPPQPGAPLLEGYNWGGLTSGSPSRALWLLLLPFTLINIAPRARPDVARDSGATRWIWNLSRLLALSLTLLLVLATAGIGIDLYGWQCLRTDVCSEAKPAWAFHHLIGEWEDDRRVGGISLGAGLLVGALLPALVLGALWWLSQRTINRYESVEMMTAAGEPLPPPVDSRRPDPVLDTVEVSLSSPVMWRNQAPVRRVRATHMQCGFSAVIGSLTLALGHTLDQLPSGSDSGTGWWPLALVRASVTLGGVVAVAVIAYGVVVLLLPAYVGWNERPRFRYISYGIWTAEIVTGLALAVSLLFTDVVAHAAAPARLGGRRSPARPLPGYDLTLLWLLTLMIVFALALTVVVWVNARGRQVQPSPPGSSHDALPTGLRGRSTAALAWFGVLLGAVYSGATYSYAAAWLNSGSVKPTHGDVTQALQSFQLPNAFGVAMITFLVSLALPALLIVAGVSWFAGRRLLRLGRSLLVFLHLAREAIPRYRSAVAIRHDYGPFEPASDDADARSRRRSIQAAYDVGSLLERGPLVLAILVVYGSLLTLVAGSLLVFSDLFHVDWAQDQIDRLLHTEDPGAVFRSPSIQAWGAYAAVLTLLGLVALSAAAFRVPQTRRVVGIVWDVASFWPRTCHPLAAPCYAERTVPDLVTRLRYLRGTERSRRVVLAGHSQGSVISAAALFHLGGENQRPSRMTSGIGLLTFGCVLRRLYARFFPGYFGVDRLVALEELLTTGSGPRWRNLWRYTDYLGGQVTQGPPQAVPEQCAPATNTPPITAPTVPPIVGDDGHAWEWHAPDPPFFARVPGDTTYSAPGRHSNFWRDPSGIYQLAVVSLDEQVRDEAQGHRGTAATPRETEE